MNIGLFLPNWVGDLVMATPALRAIRRHFRADVRLVGILRPHLADLLAGTDWLDEQWAFDPRAKDRRIGQRSLVRRMRDRRFDLVLLFTNSLRTAILAWRGGARQRLGYVADWRGPLLTGKVYPRRENGRVAAMPLVDYYLTLAEAAGCPPESPRLELACTRADEAVAASIWRELGLRTDGRVIALNCSGAYGEAKLWPEAHFAELGRRVAERTDHDVLVLCGPDEREIARRIARRAGHPRVFSLADQRLGLATSKACIRRTRLIVSTDSGPRHVAAAFGKPVVTLFGPTMPVWVENPTVRGIDLQLDLDCIGCGRRVCPLRHHKCMQELGVREVYAEVVKLLEGETSVQAA